MIMLSVSRLKGTILCLAFGFLSSVALGQSPKKVSEKKKSSKKEAAVQESAKPQKAEAPKEDTPKETGPLDTRVDGLQKFNAEDVWQEDTFDREDHKVLVLHDRKYTKTGKFELGLHVGKSDSSPFYSSIAYGLNAGYHFSEYFGVEAFGDYHKNSLTEDGKQINEFLDSYNFSSSKEYQEPLFFGGANVIWSPIYGKFAFFRKRIIYFDIFGLAGISVLNTKSNLAGRGGKNQTHPGSLLGIGMRTFINNHMSLRFDIKNSIYRSDFAPSRAGGTGSTLTRQQFQYLVGFSIFLGKGR